MYKSPHHLSVFIAVSLSPFWALAQSDISLKIEPVMFVKNQTANSGIEVDQPILILKGSMQLGSSQARLSDSYSAWHDSFAKGNMNLGSSIGVLSWEASKQSHFGETGHALSLAMTHDLNEDWYGTVGIGYGANANFLSKRRIDIAAYRKWLEDRRLITGLQFTGSRSGDGNYNDQAWQFSSSYYFAVPLVAEVGIKRTISKPGNISTTRYYGAATYGEDKKYFLSVRYDTGYEGYMPQGNFNSAVNFKSTVASVTWRQWQSPVWGYELQAERYKNPTYRRDSLFTSVFYDY